MFELSILSACSPTWTQVATGQIPISSNYRQLTVNLADCKTECQTEATCIGIAHADNGWAGFDCRLLLWHHAGVVRVIVRCVQVFGPSLRCLGGFRSPCLFDGTSRSAVRYILDFPQSSPSLFSRDAPRLPLLLSLLQPRFRSTAGAAIV